MPSIYDFQKLLLKCNAQIVKSVRGISILSESPNVTVPGKKKPPRFFKIGTLVASIKKNVLPI